MRTYQFIAWLLAAVGFLGSELCGQDLSVALQVRQHADDGVMKGLCVLDTTNRLRVMLIGNVLSNRLDVLRERSDWVATGRVVWKFGNKGKQYSMKFSRWLNGSRPNI